MIKVEDVTKTFEKLKALDGLTLHVEKASVYALIGPNGAGKTTIIKHLAGIYKQDSGIITIDSQKVYDNTAVKSRIAYIPDDLFFFSTYSIKDMAKFYKDLYPFWNEKRYEQLKDVFPINEKRRVTKLSKGMQKQVAFWLALSTMPDVLLLDEPVDGLDPIIRRKVWNLILQDVAERGTTVMISSHNLRELDDVCDHIGIINKGRMFMEKELDEARANVHKIQFAFKDDNLTKNWRAQFNILKESRSGNLINLIARGNVEEISTAIKDFDPLILNVLPLTLEEIFIYELGGQGYEVNNLII